MYEDDVDEVTLPPWFTPGTEGYAFFYTALDGEKYCLGDEGVMVVCSTEEEAETVLRVFAPDLPEDAASDWYITAIRNGVS